MNLPTDSYGILLPLVASCAWAILLLVAEMFTASKRFVGIAWLSIVGFAAVAFCSHAFGTQGEFGSAVSFDGYTVYFTYLLCALAALAVLMSVDYLEVAGVSAGEYYPLVFFAVAGMITMAAATDLIVVFLGLEIMSMAVYVLAGVSKLRLRSNEAALKYFLLGAFASAFLLYGIALVYGETGSTAFAAIASAAAPEAGADRVVLLLGAGLVLMGFAFKVAAVPFHLWTPDVYEGSPTPVTAFMATAVKAGGFAALLKTVLVALPAVGAEMSDIAWGASVLTMTVGNVIALQQSSLKRMLAYSSIAHTGYLLMGVAAGTPQAGSAVLFYLAAYGAMNLGAFGVMMLLARSGNEAERISDFAGLGRTNPMAALAMTVCMLSLTGMPPLAGFVGKFYLFAAVLDAGMPGLVVIAALNSVLAAAYYIGVIRCMYFDEGGLVPTGGRPHLMAAVVVAVALTVGIGLAPSELLSAASWAFESLSAAP